MNVSDRLTPCQVLLGCPPTVQVLANGDFRIVVAAPLNRRIWTSGRPTAQRHIRTLADNHVTGRGRVVDIRRNCNGGDREREREGHMRWIGRRRTRLLIYHVENP